jgi:hypothetical protein
MRRCGGHARFVLRVLGGVVLLLATHLANCIAQQTEGGGNESEASLAEREYDPTASLTQIQVKDIYTPAEYGTNAQLNTLQIRSIFAISPFSLIPFEQLVRPTLKIVTVPANEKTAATTTGYDDMQLLDLFVMPWPDFERSKFRWGIGPYWIFPTSTTDSSGQGAWQVGPALGFAYRAIPGLNLSGLMQQATSFAYTSSKSKPVTSITFQPMITYQLGDGWYVKSSDATWTFNLRHGTSTTIPLSAGGGKVWKLSEGYALDASLSGEWTAYRQFVTQTEQSTVNFELTMLLPHLSL